VYAQESMRFAVVDQDDWTDRCAQPPSIDTPYREGLWDAAIGHAQASYVALIEDGVPAEDARGLMPHSMTTRINYITDLRNMTEHAGNRLCTQAQFEWRTVFTQIVETIRQYNPDGSAFFADDHWQFEAIADSWMFRPVCYHTGKCEFMASADRFCSIRERVQEFHGKGVGPEHWDARDHLSELNRKGVRGIFPAEWLVDSTAARRESGGGTH
jgi:thymidylate synthase ThyX